MERVIKKDRYGNIACNNILIYTGNGNCLGENILQNLNDDWEVIKPEYYRYRDDNCLIEVWHNNTGIILDNGLSKFLKVGDTGEYWTDELREKITYEEAMYLLDEEQKKDLGYNDKDLMSKIEDELEKENNNFEAIKNIATAGLDCAGDDMVDAMRFYFYRKENKNESQDKKQNNNGGASDWYSLPKNANTLQDLIEHRNMNGSVKDIFKACYRLGIKTEDELRDLNKMAYYSLREVGRITGRKDYITIAKELMGSQAIEKE